jgi:hypothetical protein
LAEDHRRAPVQVLFVRRGGCDSPPLQHADDSDRHTTYIVVIADVLGLALSCAHFIGFQLAFKEAELLGKQRGNCGGKEGVKKEDGSSGGRREENREDGMIVAAEIDFPRS